MKTTSPLDFCIVDNSDELYRVKTLIEKAFEEPVSQKRGNVKIHINVRIGYNAAIYIKTEYMMAGWKDVVIDILDDTNTEITFVYPFIK